MKSQLRNVLPLLVLCLLTLVCFTPVMAATGDAVTVLYQNSFSSDPKWTTICPSYYYWDPSAQVYHFSVEPSSGCYAYTPISKYEKGPFTLEYDLILNHVDEGTTFRLGFSGVEMDPESGPNVLTEFTNAKNGQIMWLHLVTPGNKMVEVNSKSGDTQSSGDIAYKGSTANYELNKTYHITLNYNEGQRILTMKVNEKTSGKEIWGYYVNTMEDLRGMNRIYLGAIGDYGMMNRYATGYIDNIRLTTPADDTVASTNSTTAVTTLPAVAAPTSKKNTPVATRTSAEIPAPESTPESPLSGSTTILALGAAGLCCALLSRRRN